MPGFGKVGSFSGGGSSGGSSGGGGQGFAQIAQAALKGFGDFLNEEEDKDSPESSDILAQSRARIRQHTDRFNSEGF